MAAEAVLSDVIAGVGHSHDRNNSYIAGETAARQAMEQHGSIPDVLIVLADPGYEHQELLDGITSVAGDLPMVGGTTAGEVHTTGFTTSSVVVMALSSSKLRFHTGIGLEMSRDEEACGRALAEDVLRQGSLEEALSLLVFPNGLGGDGIKVIDGLHAVLGSEFEIVGGYLGDGENFGQTLQYFNGKVCTDAMPGLLICGREGFRTGVGVRSGFESIGIHFRCTKSRGNVVSEFDGENALDLYRKFLGEDRSTKLPGICLEYPFGLIDEKVSIGGREYFQLRCGLAVDEESGSITLAASIPEGGAITLTTATRGDIINGARLAAEQAKESLMGASPRAIFMFSCVGRKLVLGRRTQEEVDAVKEVLGRDVPLIGFYTYGEIGPISKMEPQLAKTKFHNETVVIWVLGSR